MNSQKNRRSMIRASSCHSVDWASTARSIGFRCVTPSGTSAKSRRISETAGPLYGVERWCLCISHGCVPPSGTGARSRRVSGTSASSWTPPQWCLCVCRCVLVDVAYRRYRWCVPPSGTGARSRLRRSRESTITLSSQSLESTTRRLAARWADASSTSSLTGPAPSPTVHTPPLRCWRTLPFDVGGGGGGGTGRGLVTSSSRRRRTSRRTQRGTRVSVSLRK